MQKEKCMMGAAQYAMKYYFHFSSIKSLLIAHH